MGRSMRANIAGLIIFEEKTVNEVGLRIVHFVFKCSCIQDLKTYQYKREGQRRGECLPLAFIHNVAFLDFYKFPLYDAHFCV